MKKFERNSKLNFVDENNVFLGFDYGQSCCEDFGHRILAEQPLTDGQKIIDPQPSLEDFDLDPYVFDTQFLVSMDNSDCEGGGEAIFRIVRKDDPADQKFIVLYNYHNGYYSHGFNFVRPGMEEETEYL